VAGSKRRPHRQDRVLHELGSDVNECDTHGISPAARVAAQEGHVCLRVLHELGADVNLCDTDDRSTVFAASQIDHVECIRVLHELGADLNVCSDSGITPVYAAAITGQPSKIPGVQSPDEFGLYTRAPDPVVG
jgi:ankyrin repeat protein